MRQCLGAAADEVAAAAEQVAGGPHLGRVDVRLGQQAGAEQVGDLLAVELVALGLGAVDGRISRACPRTKGMPSAAQASASQYQANMHSQATTSPSRNGPMTRRKASGLAGTSSWRSV